MMSSKGSETRRPNTFACPDFGRAERCGIPEIILADCKAEDEVIAITRRFLEQAGKAVISRVSPKLKARLKTEFSPEAVFEWYAAPRAVILRRSGQSVLQTGGKVGIITAGTADIPIAEEAALVCRETGCTVYTAYDVGVAGLHRLFGPLEHMVKEEDVDVLIVAAGMDGALPSVVSGLVNIPVIGLPTSVGYGLGGEGVGALLSMLQTCAPGLCVVNIDNGIGAGAVAARIANRVAAARKEGKTCQIR